MVKEWIFSFKNDGPSEFDLEEYRETLRILKAKFADDGVVWAESETAASKTNIWCEFTSPECEACSRRDCHERHDGRIASWRLYWDPTTEDHPVSDTHARYCEDIKRPSFSIQRMLQRKFPNNFEMYLGDGDDGCGTHTPSAAGAPTTTGSSAVCENEGPIDEPQSLIDDGIEALTECRLHLADTKRELKNNKGALRHLASPLLSNLKSAIVAATDPVYGWSWAHRASYIQLSGIDKACWGLRHRPRGLAFISGEYKILTDTLNMGWRMWPDSWTGLQMLLDLFAEKISDREDIRRLSNDEATIKTLRCIATNSQWRSNPVAGFTMTIPAAKSILRGCHRISKTGGEKDGSSSSIESVLGGFPGLTVREEVPPELCQYACCCHVDDDAATMFVERIVAVTKQNTAAVRVRRNTGMSKRSVQGALQAEH